ncbi:hypothetical protein GCM10018785_20050 [Streptomyces longispororuber]|uniref:Uncharacterized protein n=1 Tax=Streptomyces longispororuber TaxID=68230 RepID=A0A918ZFV5_9ACTN|nr:hypothetical protein GCM10018785_20050 [Streptomyces longispororuber]
MDPEKWVMADGPLEGSAVAGPAPRPTVISAAANKAVRNMSTPLLGVEVRCAERAEVWCGVLRRWVFRTRGNGLAGTGLRERACGSGPAEAGLRKRAYGNGPAGTGLRERAYGKVAGKGPGAAVFAFAVARTAERHARCVSNRSRLTRRLATTAAQTVTDTGCSYRSTTDSSDVVRPYPHGN